MKPGLSIPGSLEMGSRIFALCSKFLHVSFVLYLLTEKMYIQNLLLMSILHIPVIESFISSISEHAKLSSLH